MISQSAGRNPSAMPSLIDSITTSPEKELDRFLLQSIKRLVRSSDANVHLAFDLLMEKMKKNHSQVRYLGLLVVDELFVRSKLFRSLLVPELEMLMLHTLGYRSDFPLPPPAERATLLKAKTIELLEKWNDMFGIYYRQLRLGYEYLKDTLRFQFPNLRQTAAQAEQQRREREVRSQALIQKKFEVLVEQYPSLLSEIQSTLSQLDECLNLLANTDKEQIATCHSSRHVLEENGVDDDDGFEEYGVKGLRCTREQDGLKSTLSDETGDNPVLDTLRDLYKLVVMRHIPNTQEWLSVLMKVDPHDRQSCDSMLKSVIDVRSRMFSARSSFHELGVDFMGVDAEEEVTNDMDDIVWEAGEAMDKTDATAAVTASGLVQPLDPNEKGRECAISVGHLDKSEIVNGKNSDLVDKKISATRQQLLEQAPVLPWGSFLDRWGTESLVPANQRGLILESHWGKVDFDALIPAHKFTEMNVRASYYKPEQVKSQSCLAPLKNGGLCQRQDLQVCPFHGPIIPRDSEGNPTVENQRENGSLLQLAMRKASDHEVENSHERLNHALEPGVPNREVHRDILAEANYTVKKKDKNHIVQKTAQRLQKKRDRDHNDAVLRAAGLAHTSQGLGEVLGEDLEGLGGNGIVASEQRKDSKNCLRAMLKKKFTVKDRLAQRLLSGQAIDATLRQLSRDEESAYKEAFPNQW